MNTWVNYHSHTQYCDGENPAIEYITEAIRRGLPAYGYSSHAPIAIPSNWCIPDPDFGSYLDEVHTIKKAFGEKIQVYLGLEIDFIPGIAGRRKHLLKNTDLDYFIGSIHFVNSFGDGQPWNIDTSFELFRRGMKEIFKDDFRKAATRFYELSRQMIEEEKPDIIGHLDKIKMFSSQWGYFNENESWYRDQIDLTIRTLKTSSTIVEINTRGYYKYGQKELYPSIWIIEKLNKAGVPLMINSDAHRPKEIIEGMAYAANILKSVGVQRLNALFNNHWQDYDFDKHGLFIQ
jgi:histidinol-phosphatase (PHP family)